MRDLMAKNGASKAEQRSKNARTPTKVEHIHGKKLNQGTIEIPSIGVGQMRTSCSWIVLMLMAENSKRTQEKIIVEAMRQLDIAPEDIADQYHDKTCDSCGISIRLHRDNNGECY